MTTNQLIGIRCGQLRDLTEKIPRPRKGEADHAYLDRLIVRVTKARAKANGDKPGFLVPCPDCRSTRIVHCQGGK